MNGQLRPNVLVPIVLVAAVAGAVGFFTLMRGSGPSSVAVDAAPIAAPRRAPVTPKPAQSARPSKPARPARPAVRLKPGLPPTLARALRTRHVAVVSLVTPGASLDTTASREAAAGARAVGAAFATVDVTDERAVRPYNLMLGVLDAPSVLVFERPGNLFVRFDGFADLDTVAQAADNAR
jgi:hypothetical protein